MSPIVARPQKVKLRARALDSHLHQCCRSCSCEQSRAQSALHTRRFMLQAMLFLSALDDSIVGAIDDLTPSTTLLQLAPLSAACYVPPPLPPPLPPPPPPILLSQPSSSRSRLVVDDHVAPTGVCGRCEMSIHEPTFLLIGTQNWHAACVRCCVCDDSLAERASCYLKLGALYCRRDYLA